MNGPLALASALVIIAVVAIAAHHERRQEADRHRRLLAQTDLSAALRGEAWTEAEKREAWGK